MVYKFDILFKKTLKSGGLKVVTYSSLLQNPKAFGEGENLIGAEGQLSTVLEGPEEGYSINALYCKYRAQLVGRMNAELLGKNLQLHFVFTKPDDICSIKMVYRNVDGEICSIDTDSFSLLVAKDGDCSLIDGVTVTQLKLGQVALCTLSAEEPTFDPNSANLIKIK